MKKKNIFAIFAQAGFALAAALLISIGLASCSKDKNKVEEDVVYMDTELEKDKDFVLAIDENDGPIFVEGAELIKSEKDGGWLQILYKVSAKKLIVRGEFTRLHCGDCSLSYLDVSKKKDLKELYCEDNGLPNLDVSKNKQLEILHCYDNTDLSNLDVSKNPQLRELDCTGCGLSALDLRNNPKLTYLECHSTKITGENLKLPDVKGIGGGVLRFKASRDDNQKLSVEQVGKIKNLGWKVFFYKDGSWQEYNGED